MQSVTVDPHILAVPQTGSTPEEDLEYAIRLVDWSRLSRSRWLKLLISDTLVDLLSAAGYFPVFAALKALKIQGQIDSDLNPQTLAQASQQLLTAASLEDSCDLRDAVWEHAEGFFTTSPGWHAVLTDVLARTVLLTLILQRNKPAAPVVLGAHRLCRAAESEDVRFDSILLEWLARDEEYVRELGGTVQVVMSASAIFERANTTAILADGTQHAVEDAIAIEVLKARRTIDPEAVFGEDDFAVQGSFVEDVRALALGANEGLARRVLRACAEIVTETNLDATHALRENAGGASPQVRSYGLRAWRRRVDAEYRIHYWSGEGGEVRFASLRVHNDYNIPGPTARG